MPQFILSPLRIHRTTHPQVSSAHYSKRTAILISLSFFVSLSAFDTRQQLPPIGAFFFLRLEAEAAAKGEERAVLRSDTAPTVAPSEACSCHPLHLPSCRGVVVSSPAGASPPRHPPTGGATYPPPPHDPPTIAPRRNPLFQMEFFTTLLSDPCKRNRTPGQGRAGAYTRC